MLRGLLKSAYQSAVLIRSTFVESVKLWSVETNIRYNLLLVEQERIARWERVVAGNPAELDGPSEMLANKVMYEMLGSLQDSRFRRLARKHLVPIRTMGDMLSDEEQVEILRKIEEQKRERQESRAKILGPVLAFLGTILSVLVGASLRR